RWPAELDLIFRWYARHLERIHEDAPIRQNDLIQLGQIASGYPSRERLTELTLDPPDATSDQAGVPLLAEDYLILSTIHSAKAVAAGPGGGGRTICGTQVGRLRQASRARETGKLAGTDIAA